MSILQDITLALPRMLLQHRLTLVEKRYEAGDVITFVFRPKRRIKFKAGQYALWYFPRLVGGKPVRFFTLAGVPGEETVQFSTHITESPFKQALLRMEVGEKMYLKGPIGRLTLPKKTDQAVFIAGGIGITPIRSILSDLHQQQRDIDTIVVHSSRDGHAYRKDIKAHASKAHFVNGATALKTIRTVAEQKKQATYTIAGPPGFNKAVIRELKQAGITNVKCDGFLGY